MHPLTLPVQAAFLNWRTWQIQTRGLQLMNQLYNEDGASELTVQIVEAKSSDCLFLLNSSSMVAHVAACCKLNDTSCVVKVQDGDLTKAFRFACNVRRSALDGQIVPAEVFPTDYKLCMRPPCSKIFD